MMSYITMSQQPSAGVHSMQSLSPHHPGSISPASLHGHNGAMSPSQDWMKAWKSWASTRKRGKMAQFIIQKLEDNKQARWLEISIGKFELTEWHRIAEEWFKEKPRNSDQVDAPCMLRKGLPRAFPGLEEVKSESIKEGTQYRSRVFQAPPSLIQEVQLYISKPVMYTNSMAADMNSYTTHMVRQMVSYPQTSNGPTAYSYGVTGGGVPSPVNVCLKAETESLHDVGGSPSSSEASPYTAYTGYDGTLYNHNASATDVISGNGHYQPGGQSPYMESNSPASAGTGPFQQMLHVPNSGDVDAWSNCSSVHNSPSPRYSPDPNFQQDNMGGSQQVGSPPMMIQQINHSAQQLGLLEVNAYPNQSPLEGGGELALLFGGQLPPGPKWLSFISQARPEYVHQVEAIENNTVALTAVIPKHEIPETLNLQVVCGGRIIAHTEFTYFANAQYHCDQFFQYLNQMFPSYFPDVAGGGPMGGPLGGADETGLGGGSYGYFGNIPSSSYSLLLGACRLGIEPLIYATLQLPSMSAITPTQLSKAKELAEENGHVNAGKVLDILSGIAELTISKGSEVEPSESFIESKTGKEALAKLDYIKDDYKGGGMKILDYLAKIHKMEHRDRVEKERGSDTSGASSQIASPTVHPASPIHQPPTSADGRRQGSIKLKRQDESVREEDEPPQSDGGDELTPPTHIHSRASISEQEDQLLPLMPMRSLKGAGRAGAFGQKRLVASYSDAADSAVSMSFDHDRDFDQELLRRGSASLVSSGLYSLNSTSKEHLNITIHAQEGETFANSLQYECVYQVTEDFPPNSDSSNVILKMGDRIIQIGDQSVRGKAPEEFAEILQNEATRGTTIKILPQLSSMPSMHSLASSIGYGSLDVSERKQLARRQSDKDLTSSLTAKVSNLLTMKASNHTRSLTLPRNAGEGWGFDITGGNAVGLFVSKVNSGRKELQVGDQILELGGHNTSGMSHHEAMAILHSARDKVQLKVIENHAKFSIVKDLIELESYYIQCGIDHTPSDVRDMPLKKDRVFRVVNTVLFAGYWLAWSVDPNTGLDRELRRIPSPSKAKQQHGKEVYESIIEPVCQITAN